LAKKHNDLVSFPIHLSSEVERLFDEMIHRPWDVCREVRGWRPADIAGKFTTTRKMSGAKNSAKNTRWGNLSEARRR